MMWNVSRGELFTYITKIGVDAKLYDVETYSRVVIDEVIDVRATDIHFLPAADHYTLAYRVHGRLLNWKVLNRQLAERLISHFKYKSGMDIGERRKPQSASMIHETKQGTYSLRLSTLPTLERESLAIRILPHFSTKTLSFLSVLQHSERMLNKVSQLRRGLCLLSGPTGSGKSTTLYAIVEQILKQGGRSIITIEDPVERPIPTVIQVEVNRKSGLDFDAILRASLRHDPDVILIGEIRDEATASLAIRAALTGHLVLATVHANNCYSTILRMLDLGASQLDLKECCRLILSQRLVETRCPYCGDRCSPYCQRRRKMARAALFESLAGEKLMAAISEAVADSLKGFTKEAQKAWALGYLSTEEFARVVHEH
ncbi:competence type IV pilus ATPase ComGA [Halalkalibacter oceani]|uniref:competence type IV pilus ATPase ComGA n=1 Tax=Halalkalibacter oceani TaxID=1653776 RepID=UPI0033987719